MTKKHIIRFLSSALAVMLLLSSLTSTAFATQSNYTHFDTSSLTLTENPGQDMASLALLQIGKTGRELNYSEEWCADFVGDCAIITKQTSAVPLYGSVEGLYPRLVDAGASEVTSTPEAGDLIFINWDGEERLAHIEIIYDYDEATDTVFTVGGNTGDYSSFSDRKVSTHEIKLDSDIVKGILRPAYKYCADHSYSMLKCKDCGELRPEIQAIINQLRAFVYNIKSLLDKFTQKI